MSVCDGSGGTDLLNDSLVLDSSDVSLVLENNDTLSPDSGVANGTDSEDLADSSDIPSVVVSICSQTDLQSARVPALATLDTSSLLLTHDSMPQELSVCQYIIPHDIVGVEEVAEEVELKSPSAWTLKGSSADILNSSTDNTEQISQISSSSSITEPLHLFAAVDETGHNCAVDDQLQVINNASAGSIFFTNEAGEPMHLIAVDDCLTGKLDLVTTSSSDANDSIRLLSTHDTSIDPVQLMSALSDSNNPPLSLLTTPVTAADHVQLISENSSGNKSMQYITIASNVSDQKPTLQFLTESGINSEPLKLITTPVNSLSATGDQLRFIATTAANDDVLFTVIEEPGSPVSSSQLDTCMNDGQECIGLSLVADRVTEFESLSSTCPNFDDAIAGKFCSLSDDTRLVKDMKQESIVHMTNNDSSAFNATVLSIDEDCLVKKDEFVHDSLGSELSHFAVIETSKLNDIVMDQVIEMTENVLDSKTSLDDLTCNDDTNFFTFSSTLADPSTAYPNIVWGYSEGAQNGKTLRLKVHKVIKSDELASDQSKKPINGLKEDELFKCKECDFYLKSGDDLKAHMEAHLVKLQNSCPLCSVEFPSKPALQVHIRQHFTKIHQCNICSEKFANKNVLRSHKLKQHSVNASTITPNSKNSVSVQTTILKDTIRTVPSVVRNITRAVATSVASAVNKPVPVQSSGRSGISLPNVAGTGSDMAVSSTSGVRANISPKVFKCSLCKMVFVCRAELKQHSTSHFQKPFKCDQCGATFTQNGSLQVHIRRHRGEKPFTCDLCGNSYTRAFSLKVHMKTHTGEKPHACEFCGSSFITSSHLNVHRRIHTGERPFSCPDCSATFITTSHLNVHKRMHAVNSGSGGGNTTRCTQCNTTFKDVAQLRMHRRTHHAYQQQCQSASSSSALNVARKKASAHFSNHPSTCRCRLCTARLEPPHTRVLTGKVAAS